MFIYFEKNVHDSFALTRSTTSVNYLFLELGEVFYRNHGMSLRYEADGCRILGIGIVRFKKTDMQISLIPHFNEHCSVHFVAYRVASAIGVRAVSPYTDV